jgi:hypothetical protein
MKSSICFLKKITALAVAVVLCLGLSVPAYAVKPDLDEATKAIYYAEYLKIAQEVNQEMDAYISVNPIDELSDEDWMEPEEFRTFIKAIAGWTIVCTEPGPSSRSTGSATKSASISVEGSTYTIYVKGSFSTQYDQYRGRQLFTTCNSITSSASASQNGSWTQTGYEALQTDGGRTYCVDVSGTFKLAAATFENKIARAEFYCSAVGKIL